MTNKDRIIKRLRETGAVDNFWAVNNKVSLRLGAVIHVLKQEGWNFTNGGYIPGTKNWEYRVIESPKEKQEIIGGVGHLPTYEELEAKGMFA